MDNTKSTPGLTPEQKADVCRRYKDGESAVAIGRDLGLHRNSIYHILKKNGIKRRSLNSFSETEEQHLCERYQAGETISSIASDYGLRREGLWTIIKRRGTTMRRPSERGVVYHCDHSFFDSIDTEEKAYVAGFVAADGYIHNSEDRLAISLHPDDREHLVRIKYALKSTHPIKDCSSYSRYHGRVTTQSKLSIGSSALVRALGTHGIGNAKTFTLEWPRHLEPDLLRHFLRGAVDGDGSFWYSARRKPEGWDHNYGFALIGSWPFVTDCQHYLVKACDLNYTKLDSKTKSPEVATVRYGGKRQVERIFHHLYDDASIFMLRKYYELAYHF